LNDAVLNDERPLPDEFPQEPKWFKVHCRRIQQRLPLTEHAKCPYCFGSDDDIRTRDHEFFCDFKVGKDPINFGFPENYGPATRY